MNRCPEAEKLHIGVLNISMTISVAVVMFDCKLTVSFVYLTVHISYLFQIYLKQYLLMS